MIMMMMMITIKRMALVTENGNYLSIQELNYVEGLLFTLEINFRLCQISGI
jgi:hypothetical protein